MPVITASIVLYKSGPEVRKTINDFLNTTLAVHIYLIDNSPTDTLKHELKDVIEQERVTYIFNNKNLGYGAGHNVAMRQIIKTSKYHLVLNPDISFEQGTLEKLFAFAEENKEIGLVMPRVIYPNGEIQYVCKLLPTPLDLIFRRFLPASLTAKRMERYELRKSGYNHQFEVPYVHGCFMFLRTEVLKTTGLFDERFFMYPEDIDLTRRIYAVSKCVFYPGVEVIHAHAKASYKNFRLFLIHLTNLVKYFNKWGWIFDRERSRINEEILLQFERVQ